MTRSIVPVLALVSVLMTTHLAARGLQRQACDTLTPVEMNHGDTLQFRLANVEVRCPGAINSPQRFRVRLVVSKTAPQDSVIVDDQDEGRDGFVEFHAQGASGLLIADAVEFSKVSDTDQNR